MTPPTSKVADVLHRLGPALLGAGMFGCSDIFSRYALLDGADVLTNATFRSYVGVVLLFLVLKVLPRAAGASGLSKQRPAMSRRHMWFSLLMGVLFTGNVFFLYLGYDRIVLPVAILVYFTYPLFTGIAGAATGLDRLSWRGAVTALVAFLGLALMVGASPVPIGLVGLLALLAASSFRVSALLLTRAALQEADAWQITWYSMLSSTVLFSVAWLALSPVELPQTGAGWFAMTALGVTTTLAIMGVYLSTIRIGPFNTALFMNLEPLLAVIGAAIFLGETVTLLQAVGSAVMLAALVLFQLRR